MAKANSILLNSILWNLREISKLAEIIKESSGDVNCTSWRYPLINCSELEIFKLIQNNRSLDNYTYILELTYDRLLYILNLIIKYMESYDTLESFRPDRNIRRPMSLSLASVLSMIWDRIKAQMENAKPITTSESKESESCKRNINFSISTNTVCTQSEVCSISVCSCCEMVQNFVTHLVLQMEIILEKHNHESAITALRESIKHFLVEMTNWSVMSKWLEAITKDFNAISEKSEHEALKNQKLRHRIDSEEKKMKLDIEQFEKEAKAMESRIHEYESKASASKSEIEKLLKENHQLKEEITNKDLQLSNASLNLESKIQELKKNYEQKLIKKKEKIARKDIEKEKEHKIKLQAEIKKREFLERENRQLQEQILKIKEDFETTNAISDQVKQSLEQKYKGLEQEFENLKKESFNLNELIAQKQNQIDDYSKRLMEAYPQLNDTSKVTYKASGNPVTDIESQIEANNLRMESLEAENYKLKMTLHKIKMLKA